MMHHSSLANPLHIYHMDALSKPPPYQPHALIPNDRGLICGIDAVFWDLKLKKHNLNVYAVS